MLVVWAASPLSSLLTLDRKSRPPDVRPSLADWLLRLSLLTRLFDLLKLGERYGGWPSLD